MSVLIFLILFPLVVAFFSLFARGRTRDLGVMLGSAAIGIASLLLLTMKFNRDVAFFSFDTHLVDKAMLGIEAFLGIYIFVLGIKSKKYLVSALIASQLLLIGGFELLYGKGIHVEHSLFLDKLSILMALVVGIIGTAICVYAVGYMKEFHAEHHPEMRDRRGFFFFLLFAFLSAMFGIVFSNNLLWLYFFWEITTLCSFFLIGYKGSKKSQDNAFLALVLNLVGGLAFAGAIVYLYFNAHALELNKIMSMGKAGIMIPVALISIAGLTKSAQLPFSSWLLGAMVAPTPVSALLHSSTMVKAGVYIILRFATVLEGTVCGFVLALIGGITFVVTSFIAITQSDAKKILAYSTIANLGLIVLCAGVGTYEAAWAGLLLILFHAVAKCLLFLCVGIVEHKLHSRNIEDMQGLILSMPKVSIMMQIGMAGMFLAPFGMLISKWVVLKALVDYNPILAVFVVFGSAAGVFFWVKWMGILITVTRPQEDVEQHIGRSVWGSLGTLAVLTVCLCGLFPIVSKFLVQPYVSEIYGKVLEMGHGNIVIMMSMLAMVMLFPLSFLRYGKNVKVVDAYLAGANVENGTRFRGAAGVSKDMAMRSYYMEAYFGEHRLLRLGIVIAIILILILCGAAL